jgi:hypothetical protein
MTCSHCQQYWVVSQNVPVEAVNELDLRSTGGDDEMRQLLREVRRHREHSAAVWRTVALLLLLPLSLFVIFRLFVWFMDLAPSFLLG